MCLSELQEIATLKGFTHHFSAAGNHVTCDGKEVSYSANDLTIIDSRSVDSGTDPGDDATLYMIEACDGTRGTLIVPSSFYTEHEKAELIDHLRSQQRESKSGNP